MSHPMMNRSGVPRVERLLGIDTTGRRVDARDPDSNRRSPTLWVRIRNVDTVNTLEVYFTELAYQGGSDYVALAPGEILEGPMELSPPTSEAHSHIDQGCGAVWLAAAAGTADVELLVTFR